MANFVAVQSSGDAGDCDNHPSLRRQTMIHMAAFKYNTITAQSLISSIDFSDDGLHGLTAHRDHRLRLYDVCTAVMRDRITLLVENYGDQADDMTDSITMNGGVTSNNSAREELDYTDGQSHHTVHVNRALAECSSLSCGSYVGCSTARFTHSSNVVAFTPLTKYEAPVCLLNIERGVVLGAIHDCSLVPNSLIDDNGIVKQYILHNTNTVPYTAKMAVDGGIKQENEIKAQGDLYTYLVGNSSTSMVCASSRYRYMGAMAVHSAISPVDDMMAVARGDGAVMLCDPSVPRPLFVLDIHQHADLPPPSSPLASMYFSMCPRANYVSFSPAEDCGRYLAISRPFLGIEIHDRRMMSSSLSEYKLDEAHKNKPSSLVTSITQGDVFKMWKNNGILSQEVYSYFSSIQLGASHTAICCLGDGRCLQLRFDGSKESCSPMSEYGCFGELDHFFRKRQDTYEVGGDGMEIMLNIDGTPPCCGALFTQPDNPCNSKVWQGSTRCNANFAGSSASLLYEPPASSSDEGCTMGILTNAVFPVDMGPTNALAVNRRFQILASATRCLNWWAIVENEDTDMV